MLRLVGDFVVVESRVFHHAGRDVRAYSAQASTTL